MTHALAAEEQPITLRSLAEERIVLRDLVGLTAAELIALRRAAGEHLKTSDIARAAQIYGLIVMIDPLEPTHWIDLAETHERAESYIGALVCWEIVGLLQGRDQRSVAHQARLLRVLGLDRASRIVAHYVHAFASPGSNKSRFELRV